MQIVTICIWTTDEILYITDCSFILNNSYPKVYFHKTLHLRYCIFELINKNIMQLYYITTPIWQLKCKSTFSLQNSGSKHNFLNHGLPLNLAIKPYLALKGSVAFPPENGVQNAESTPEKREIGDEENAAKFPIGRRDFDSE